MLGWLGRKKELSMIKMITADEAKQMAIEHGLTIKKEVKKIDQRIRQSAAEGETSCPGYGLSENTVEFLERNGYRIEDRGLLYCGKKDCIIHWDAEASCDEEEEGESG